jgi:DNA-binding NtrC family response regulator
VLQAENGEQAFEILASKPHLDMLITDFRLPGGISGVQIAEPALKVRPELKVIFISGYPQEILDCNSPITRNAPILAKPFDLDTLQEHIQRLLA